jgi:hypothetical protein
MAAILVDLVPLQPKKAFCLIYVGFYLAYSSTLMMKASCSSYTLVDFQQTALLNHIFLSRLCEISKFNNFLSSGYPKKIFFYGLARHGDLSVLRYFILTMTLLGPPLWSSGHSSWLLTQRSGFDFRRYQIFWVAVGLERGPLSPCESKWGATWKKSSGSGLENW